MSCTELTCSTCGTGKWDGPRPGDPLLDGAVLTATPGFGGVNVSWTYPESHAHAIAHTIVYRGNQFDFSSAIEIARIAGNRYFDPLELTDNSNYWYWIQLVSIHGEIGKLIGPALCSTQSTIGKIIDELSGQIGEGALHQALVEKISRIEMIGDGLVGESKAREEDILEIAKTIKTLEVSVDDSMAMITTETQARISTIDALARELLTLEAEFGDRTALLQQELGVLVTETESIGRAVTAAQVTADDAMAAFREERTARINAIEAVADSIDSVESQMGNQLAQAETRLSTRINTVSGRTESMYTAKLQSGNLIGGFGLYNDGHTVDAGFVVDRFWIGSTSSNRRKPFIVKNGQVYMNSAVIENASITNAMIANSTIQAAKIADGSITNAKIANGTITNAKIQDASIEFGKINNFVAHVANVANAQIGSARIDFAQINNVQIASGHIQDLSVGTLKIQSGAVSNMGSGSSNFTIDTSPSGASVVLFYKAPSTAGVSASARVGGITATSRRITVWDGDFTSYETVVGMAQGRLGSGIHTVSVPGGIAVALVLKR